MSFQESDFFYFLQNLGGSSENENIRWNYNMKISLIKSSIKIPKEMPTMKDLSRFLPKEPSEKKLRKSFFSKTKAILFWLISAYECFKRKSLEEFV